jgi:hypothetical protein
MKTATILQWSHQINVKMRKMSLQDRDWLGLQVHVGMDLGLLAVEAGSRPGGDVAGKPSPDKPRRYRMPGGKPPRM